MARLRFLAVALLALALAGNSTQMGRTQALSGSYTSSTSSMTTTSAAVDHSCVIYSLTEMGYDADLGKWISQTIPEMVEPNSWQQQGGSGVVRYYAPKNILIVKQSPAIQRKVDGFMKELKTSLPKASASSFGSSSFAKASVVPADYREPALLRTSNTLTEPSSYPVPAAVKPPKHLFHFIIRYEGEGIIDNNVVKFMKTQGQGLKIPYAPTASPNVGATAPTPADSQGEPLYMSKPPVSEIPPTTGYSAPASPYSAPPPGWTAPSASTPSSAPTPSAAPDQPSNSPKKKENKKDNKTKKVASEPAYLR